MKTDNVTGKVFKFDQSEEKEKGEKEQTESRLNIEVGRILNYNRSWTQTYERTEKFKLSPV